MRVKDKSIIVTGAGGGIGEGIAKRLAAERRPGHRQRHQPRRSANRWSRPSCATAAGLRSSPADVTKSDRMKALVDAAVQRHGKLDAMVNNAGWTHRNRPALRSQRGRVRPLLFGQRQEHLPVDHPCGAGLPGQRRRIVHQHRLDRGRAPRPGLTWYNGSKGAVITTSKSLAAELGPDNIRVNCINPVFNPDTGLRGRVRRWSGHRRAQGQVPRHHPAGPLLDRARRRQRGALPGQRRGLVHQRGLHRGRRRPLRSESAPRPCSGIEAGRCGKLALP